MKIISQYKDYYDRVAAQYGGGDPTIPYIRPLKRTFPERLEFNHFPPRFGGYEFQRSLSDYLVELHKDDEFEYYSPEYKWLAFCGKYYLIIINNIAEYKDKLLTYNKDWKVITHKSSEDVFKYITEKESYWDQHIRNRIRKHPWTVDDFGSYKMANLIGLRDENIDIMAKELTKKMNRPIPMFIIGDSDKKAILHRRLYYSYIGNGTGHKFDIPKINYDFETYVCLNDLGFASIMSAEQCYQEIESYLVNVLRDNPDKNPPVQIADRDKINQHGFDLKQSFRHRKDKWI